MTQLVQVIVLGLGLGSIYFLLAVGVTVVFGQTRLVNFAHGQLLVLAGLSAWFLVDHGFSFYVAVPLVVLEICVLAWLAERVLLHRLVDDPFAGFIVTLGLLIILQEVCVSLFGSNPKQLQTPIEGSWAIGGVNIPYTSAAAFAGAAVIAIALWLLFGSSRTGRAIRASAEDAEAGAYLGLRVEAVRSAVFVLGSGLAAVAGCFFAMNYPLSSLDGGTFIITGFAIALVGGLGSVPGAAVAGLLLGLLQVAGQSYWKAEWVPALSFALIIVTLLIRPSGLFGKAAAATDSVVAGMPPNRPAPRWAGPAFAIGAIALVTVPLWGVTAATLYLAGVALVWAALATAIGLLFRGAGVLSFGHGAFFGVGAYIAAYASLHWQIGFWLSIPIAFTAVLVVGAVLALPLFRIRGFYFLIVTLAIANFAVLVENNALSITNGSDGLTVLTAPGSVLGINFEDPNNLYYLLAAILGAMTLACWLIERSGFGRRLAAIRDNDVLARSFGINDYAHLVAAFAISAGLAAIAGVLFVYQTSAITPSQFSALATVTVPIMVIFGGSRSIAGPALGAVLLTFMPYWLNFGPSLTNVVYGALLIAVMMLMPEGVAPGIFRITGRLGRHRGPTDPMTTEAPRSDPAVGPPGVTSGTLGGPVG